MKFTTVRPNALFPLFGAPSLRALLPWPWPTFLSTLFPGGFEDVVQDLLRELQTLPEGGEEAGNNTMLDVTTLRQQGGEHDHLQALRTQARFPHALHLTAVCRP